MRLSTKSLLSIFVIMIAFVFFLILSTAGFGFDTIQLVLLFFIALIIAIFAFIGSSIYELVQTMKLKEKELKEGLVVHKDMSLSKERCYYHMNQAHNQCEKCNLYICKECAMVFNYPFSGTLISFAEEVGKKHIYCPICYWKRVEEMASSWSLRFIHVLNLSILLVMLNLFLEGIFRPITKTFPIPLNASALFISLFLSVFVFAFLGLSLLILYSLLIDGPRRTNKAKVKLQEFLAETGTSDNRLH